jgi:phosphomannomutase
MNPSQKLPAEIFKAYDIRGIVGKSLTADVVRSIGHALGSLAIEQGQRRSPSAATVACPARNYRAR